MSLDQTRDWLKAVLRPYPSRDRILPEVLGVLSKHRTLSVKTDAFTFDSGHTALLLLLHGTLPISYRNATYHIPVHIWLPHEYPRNPPMAFVVPTASMSVRKSREIDPSGRVKDAVMESWWNSWLPNARDLSAAIAQLVALFEIVPPVYAKPPEQVQQSQRPQRQQSQPAQPDQLPQYRPDQVPSRQGSASYPISPVGNGERSHSRSNSAQLPPGSPPVPLRPGQQPPVPQRPFVRPAVASPISPTGAAPAPWHQPPPPPPPPQFQPPQQQPPQQAQQHPRPPQEFYNGQNQQFTAGQWSQQPPAPPHISGPPPVQRNSLPPQPNHQPPPQSAPTPPTDIMDMPDAPAPPRPDKPPPPSTVHLHAILLPHLQAALPPLLSDLEAQKHHLLERKEDLASGEPAVRDEMARLEAVRKVCQAVEGRMEGVVSAGEKRVAELEERGDVSVDEVVCGISIVHNQLVDLVAEDNAISDTIYHVTRALDAERLDIDRYLKAVRALAREQYMKRALVERILAGMGQKNWD